MKALRFSGKVTAGPGASERPFCGCDVLCLFHSERDTHKVGSFHVGKRSTVLSEFMSSSETDKWQVPDDASSHEEDASPYLPYHHEPLAFEWSSSSESEDVDGPSLDVGVSEI